MTKQDRISRVISYLSILYPEAKAELNFSNPYETLVATILSAQCTDKRVNMVTESLFRDYPDAASISKLGYEQLEERIRECGLFRAKAKHIIDACTVIARDFGGIVPSDRKTLTNLPGVGNKTAGVVMMAAFGSDEIPVDTHVFRLSHRLGLVENANTPDAVEAQLRAIIPEGEKPHVHHLLIWHGRRCCKAINPECERCPLRDICEREKTE